MTTFFYKNILTITGVLVGALAGFLYWKFVGCHSGNCAITSDPTNSTVYGAVMGGLFLSVFKKENTNSNDISGSNSAE